ncbi:9210_t:CDS:2, partial [Entrophospora sp. SA101]
DSLTNKIPLISHIMLNVMSGSGGGTVNGAILIVLDKVIHKLIEWEKIRLFIRLVILHLRVDSVKVKS